MELHICRLIKNYFPETIATNNILYDRIRTYNKEFLRNLIGKDVLSTAQIKADCLDNHVFNTLAAEPVI